MFSSQKVVSHAEGLWERMKDRGDKEFPITHDGMKVIQFIIYYWRISGGVEVGLNREGLINFLFHEKGGLLEGGGLFENGD